MKYQINRLSLYAEQILGQLTTGTVHSVYRRTINLTDGKQILSLQTDHSPLSPLSLISALSPNDMNKLPVRAGDPVSFEKDGFQIASSAGLCRFTCAKALRYDLKLAAPLDDVSRQLLCTNIQNALSAARPDGFASFFVKEKESACDSSLILLTAQTRILRCNELCLQNHYPQAALELSRLIGLGIGLTPSGDDFLCGVLAGFCLCGSTEHAFALRLKSEIARHLSSTIDISAAFLACALDHQYSLPVNLLSQIPSPQEILSSFSEMGHSSGIDTLCGVLWSLEHIF